MQHLESLFDRALDAVVGMDSAGDVAAWNLAAEEIFGWSREEAMGASMGELIVPPQHRESHSRGLEHYKRTGIGPVLEKRVRITAMHRDGDEFPVELSIFPMVGADSALMFYAFIRSLKPEQTFLREQELRASEANALMKIGQKLIEDVSLEQFTKFCLDEVCEIAGMDAAHLFVARGQGETRVLVPSETWYLRNEQYRPVITETAGVHLRIGQGLPGLAWQTGELEALNDLENDGNFVRRAVFARVGLTRGVAVPVQHGGEVHAILEFFGTKASRLDPEILRMLKTVGSQIGAAIRRKEEAENRETLRREMAHRVGNSLMVLSSIYRSCSRNAASKDELDEAFLGRIMAMGRANQMAIVEADQGVVLPDLINNSLCILPDRQHVTVVAPDILIGSDQVMPLSLVLNELATNTLKYGTLGSESRLDIHAETCGVTGELLLTWEELRFQPHDLPPPQPIRVGFGTRLIRTMIEGRIRGSYQRVLDETGFHFVIRMSQELMSR